MSHRSFSSVMLDSFDKEFNFNCALPPSASKLVSNIKLKSLPHTIAVSGSNSSQLIISFITDNILI